MIAVHRLTGLRVNVLVEVDRIEVGTPDGSMQTFHRWNSARTEAGQQVLAYQDKPTCHIQTEAGLIECDLIR